MHSKTAAGQAVSAGETERRVKNAMLLAAGLGSRLQPLTDRVPKPLVRVAGQSLLKRGLDILAAAGIERAVINVHYLAEQMMAAVKALRADYAMELLISDESEQLLDSAGGIIKALPLLGNAPFFVLNADSFWREVQGQCNNWRRLGAAFNPAEQDMLLLTVPRAKALVPQQGDFTVCARGESAAAAGANAVNRLKRADKSRDEPQAVIYTGGMILNPAIFAGAAADTPQSLHFYFDKALAQKRLYGLNLEAQWFSVGSLAELKAAEFLLRAQR